MKYNWNTTVVKYRALPFLFLLSAIWVMSCSSSEDQYSYLEGKWNARWEMDQPAEMSNLDKAQFSMDGQWEFHDEETVTIAAYGREGCILGEDTLIHTQQWYMSGDTIHMKSENQIAGLLFKVLEGNESDVKLQVLPDVHVYLSR